MKLSVLTAFMFLAVLPACKKNTGDTGMIGSWEVIEVFDKSTSTADYPPAGSSMNIVISFLSANQFAGHTLRNTLDNGTYTLNGNEIVFQDFSMTKVGEDKWGASVLTILHACLLQSVSPCVPSKISVQGNVMKIASPLRYDITLRRL